RRIDAEASSGGDGRRAKKSKKKDESRPVLVALPSAPPPGPVPIDARGSERRAHDQRGQERRPTKDRVPPAVRAPIAPSSPSPSASGRAKRELPPYLRVVK